MHLYDILKGDKALQFCQTTLKMAAAEYDMGSISHVEIHGTDLDDPGEDYCEYRVYDHNNKLVVQRRELGY